MKPKYPTLSDVADGQVLGAEQLKSYNAALEHLYAESHAPFPLGGAMLNRDTDHAGTAPTYPWTGYTRHAGAALQYCFEIGENDGGGGSYHAAIQYYGDDQQYHTAATISGVGSATVSGVVDISGATLTPGEVTLWRVGVYGDDSDYNVSYMHWWLGEYNTVGTATWATPHVFSASAILPSQPADFNDWHTDLDLLNDVIPDMQWLTSNTVLQNNSDNDWHAVFRGVYPYRPDQLYLALCGRLTGGYTWQWRADLEDTSAHTATIYTSGTIAGTGANDTQSTTVDLSTGTAAGSAIAAGTITLTLGSYYRVTLYAKKITTLNAEVLYSHYAYMMRVSDGEPNAVSNLLTNGDFETKGAGGADVFGSWTETAGSTGGAAGTIGFDATRYYAGTLSAMIVGGTLNPYMTQSATTTAGMPYSLGFYTRGDGTNAGRYALRVGPAGAYIVPVTSTGVTGTAWTAVANDFTTPAGCTSVVVYFWGPTATGGTAWFDSVTLAKEAWAALPAWEHGDQDIGPAKLNIVSRNIPIFNSGGAEQLFGSNLISPAYADEGTTERRHTGVHRKQYLHYLPINGTLEPTIHYGSNMTRQGTESLGAGTTWLDYDLEQIDNLCYGMYYDVKDAIACYEADD